MGALAVAALGDTVKLKDGTVYDGNIVSEDDQKVVLEAEYGAGTIRQTLTFPRSNVVEVLRLNSEQKAEREMRQAYEALQRYPLRTNYTHAYYDQVISNVFLNFLARYPNSPQAGDVSRKISAWETARDGSLWTQVKKAVPGQGPSSSGPVAVPNLPTADAPVQPHDVDRTVLDDMVDWIKEHWVSAFAGILVVVAIVWKITHP